MYLLPLSKSQQQYGYENFFITPAINNDFLKDRGYIYHSSTDNYNSSYDILKKNVFTVTGVTKNNSNQYFLQLKNNTLGEICYYKYKTVNDLAFPFIIQGYVEKATQRFVGKEVETTGEKWTSGDVIDAVTGRKITIDAGKRWKISEIVFAKENSDEPPGLDFMLKNKAGESIAIPFLFTNDKYLLIK